MRAMLASLLLLFCLSSEVLAAPDVLVIGDDRDLHHSELVGALRARLKELRPAATLRFQDAAEEPDLGPATLLVTLGSEVSQRLVSHPKVRATLHTLVTANWFERAYTGPRGATSALYIDQPIDRVVRLITTALPNRSVASITGPFSRLQAEPLAAAARRHGLTLTIESITESSELDGAVSRLVDGGRPLLILPDPVVVSASTAKTLLVGTYLRHIPVIGYSQAIVKAGAVLAVHSNPAQLGRQAAEMLVPLLERPDARLPDPQYPRYFSVSANFQVARALELELPSERELTERLRRSEGQPE